MFSLIWVGFLGVRVEVGVCVCGGGGGVARQSYARNLKFGA